MDVPTFIWGNIAPCYTVWKDDESWNEVGQRNLWDFMLSMGAVDSYFIRSGMGQMYAYTYDDVKALCTAACDHFAGKAPVLMNCSGIWDANPFVRPDPAVYTQQAVELSQFAEQAGADAVVHVVPQGLLNPDNLHDKDAIYYQHYETVCAAVDAPVIVYHPPVDFPFTAELMAKVANIPNLVGTKISSVNGFFLYDAIRAVRDKEFHVITGAEMLYYATLQVGSRAVIGGGCNHNPQVLKAVLTRFEAGDWEATMDAQDSVNRLYKALPDGAITMKQLATEAGYPVGITARTNARPVYKNQGKVHTEEKYEAFKKVRDEELARYA
jgi:dihydrodipicolinate synthase/N-acetylneuraminate lyase